jgi:DNA-binding NarL/FixJ family response regulator
MLTRQEREQLVIDLYNQGKTIRDIAKEVRMSFRDIGTILKKEEEKEKQKKQQESNTTSIDNDNNQQVLPLSTQAYERFSQGKNPIQVAIELNLRESQVKLHKINLILLS